ncbi:hypothetical protein PanWU01x14_282420 [Parasponia andersonii]|uniref:Uncharacterized protein n=1 Tax=Parasponia andersonii TaxID=3476 RepID=A0A2P5B0Q5_PARAD|nr:hypothetical protein PanWU01x14_282420 [Parasponia andersonii]
MPPHEDLVEEALVPSVVGNDVVPVVHEDPERAVRWLHDHDPGVEDGEVVPDGRDLRELEEDVEVPEHGNVGVYEDDLVVVGELPEAELAVVVLVVGVLQGPRVSDPGYEPDPPPGLGERRALRWGDGLVDEDDEVPGGAALAEALGQRYGAAHVGLRRVEHGGVGLSLRLLLCGLLGLGGVMHVVDSCTDKCIIIIIIFS